jgi:hypothetical protein
LKYEIAAQEYTDIERFKQRFYLFACWHDNAKRLDKICAKLGQSQSETLRIALLDYAKDISLITEKVHTR